MKIKNYLSLVKFSHTIFAMPFAIIGFFLATHYFSYTFDWMLFVKVLLAMVFARNAAMGFNRYIDRAFDKENPRTSKREIPQGLITAKNAFWFVLINAILFIIMSYYINMLCFYLSFLALFVVLAYSYTKRFTFLCHFFLSIALSIAPTAAFIAVSEEFKLIPILLSIVVFFWVSGFDIIFALQDEAFDKGSKLFSIPSVFGAKKALLISALLHLCSVLVIVMIGVIGELNFYYWIGATVFTILMTYQHWIVKPNDLSRVNIAFGTTNGVASILYASFFLLDLFFLK